LLAGRCKDGKQKYNLGRMKSTGTKQNTCRHPCMYMFPAENKKASKVLICNLILYVSIKFKENYNFSSFQKHPPCSCFSFFIFIFKNHHYMGFGHRYNKQ